MLVSTYFILMHRYNTIDVLDKFMNKNFRFVLCYHNYSAKNTDEKRNITSFQIICIFLNVLFSTKQNKNQNRCNYLNVFTLENLKIVLISSKK